ncbi:hypothetical protein EG028_26510 [Chitinophaga barathri]|uniref:Uncharacterized protein n=2 Tax=Chitinophaga barathri TaxID=1647451 RepID=A0A3N4M5I0_9BACT|nr:hypothetical protein EG028_26510 [Chitinophaga barathri]
MAAALLLALTSCKKDPKESKYETMVSPVYDTELLNHTGGGLTINMKVTFAVFNGCGQFGSFVSSTQADTLVVKVLGRYPKEAVCTDDIPTRTATFTKTYPSPGTYYIKWVGPGAWGPESMIHRDTIVLR